MKGTCHCGKVEWTMTRLPESATTCNCTVCRRYGSIWAYGYQDEDIHVSGETTSYVRGDSIGFHFCPSCGCITYWRGLQTREDGRRRIAVNLRLTEPDLVADIPIRRFEGLESFKSLDDDSHCVADFWF